MCVVVVAGSCFPRFRGRQEFVMGSLWAHGGSTTFPWVPSRPVQLGYDRAVRAAWVSCYHWWCHVWSSCKEFVMPNYFVRGSGRSTRASRDRGRSKTTSGRGSGRSTRASRDRKTYSYRGDIYDKEDNYLGEGRVRVSRGTGRGRLINPTSRDWRAGHNVRPGRGSGSTTANARLRRRKGRGK